MVISVGEATCALLSVCMQPEQKSTAANETGSERVTVFQDMDVESRELSASNASPLQSRLFCEIDIDDGLGLRLDIEEGAGTVLALACHQPAAAQLPHLVGQGITLGGHQIAHLIEHVC